MLVTSVKDDTDLQFMSSLSGRGLTAALYIFSDAICNKLKAMKEFPANMVCTSRLGHV